MKTGLKRWFWLAIMPIMAFGCGDQDRDQRREPNDLIVRSNGDEVNFFSPDGQLITDGQLASLVQERLLGQGQLSFAPLLDPSDTSRFQIGKYRYSLRWVKHYVGGLINLDIWHLDFRIEDTSIEPIKVLLDLHIVGWKDENGFHLGILNSVNNWCRVIVAKFSLIKATILEGIKNSTKIPEKIAAPIAHTTSVIVALVYGIPRSFQKTSASNLQHENHETFENQAINRLKLMVDFKKLKSSSFVHNSLI